MSKMSSNVIYLVKYVHFGIGVVKAASFLVHLILSLLFLVIVMAKVSESFCLFNPIS